MKTKKRRPFLSAPTSAIVSLMMLHGWFELKASAEMHESTITSMDGKVMLLTKSPTEKGPTVKFEGQLYKILIPTAGQKIRNGDLLRTFPASAARMVFTNGDQINLVAGSAYQISWKTGRKPEVKLLQGSLRSTVEPGGPQQGMTVRARSAVMGVRGTEIFVEDAGVGANARSNFVVLRGKAELQSIDSQGRAAPPVPVTQGQVATVAAPPPPPPKSVLAAQTGTTATPPPAPVIQQASKEELTRAESALVIPPKASSTPIPEELRALEQKAVQVVPADVKIHEPELFKKIEKDLAASGDISSVDPEKIRAIQNQTVVTKIGQAPSRPEPEAAQATPPAKPSMKDLERSSSED